MSGKHSKISDLVFKKGYQEDIRLRNSFNELASNVFGISFDEWYQKGYWTDKYVPFSYIREDKVIANVSVNKIDFVINGETKRAIQIGTVMTDPEHRNQGLSRKLIDLVFEEYEDTCDLIYLFANQSVLDFYPKFGFRAIEETQFSMEYKGGFKQGQDLRRLNGYNEEDLHFIYHFAADRQPVSNILGTMNTQELLMFYCVNVFHQDVYYIKEHDILAIFQHHGEEMHIFDIISHQNFEFENLLKKTVLAETKKIVFHFTPDFKTETRPFKGSEVLFVKSKGEIVMPEAFKHPLTSQA
ncbi:GNAT family N-acetyltransferase [Bacillus sp. M6-12]|uniref:GNAT family N-acetyltransferase n=1 Tax=Bacillus sp. M6-12 TaxID=2054166 RepID=UPI0015E156E0|nr:GNAT family N-acetyltransferase [Bacillus sp. M6-12]